MGTTTVYLKHSDFGRPLHRMSLEELERLATLSPYGTNNSFLGWTVPCELHNGNVYVMIFWKGRLLTLELAARTLTRKYYDKYRGKARREYEWTLLKKVIDHETKQAEAVFTKELRRIHHGQR